MISELRTFIAVCRYRTFAAAGERIGLTQSAVSSQIKRLENQLGFDLFNRTGRSATLNAAGETILARAEQICSLYGKLGEAPNEATLCGPLRMGAIASPQPTLIARTLARLRARFPLLQIHILPGLSTNLMDELDAGRVDAAVIIRPPLGIPSEWTWQPLIFEPYVLIAPAGLPGDDWRTIIQEQPFIRYNRMSFGGRLVEKCLRQEAIVVKESIETDEIPGIIHLVGKGLGVAMVPLVEADLPLPASVRMLSLGRLTFYREIGILHRKLKASPPVIGHLVQCLLESVNAAQRHPHIPESDQVARRRPGTVRPLPEPAPDRR
jgi:DNA-binding transcriptional LysR family regulator